MRKAFLMLVCLTVLGLGCAIRSHAATNNDYCVFPIFATNAVKPNVMITMDLSGSMQFPAYVYCNFTNYESSPDYSARCYMPKNGTGQTAVQEYYDASKYDTTRRYYGYFDADSCYQYSTTNARFEVNTSGTCTNKIGTSTAISGNLLNWITATRVDVVRKALTGGRVNSTQTDTLQSEGGYFYGSSIPSYYDSSFADVTTGCKFRITRSSYSYNRILAQSNAGCPLGTFTNRNIRVKVDPTTISGIVDDFYNKVFFEFMGFRTDPSGSSTYYGKILTGKNATLATLKSQISTALPYYGTPTGEALRSANNFFRQSTYYSGLANNSAYISKADGDVDPYYDKVDSADTAIPCRRSFVLLFSDGQWNGSYDSAGAANALHINDLRSELTGTQNVNIYTIYAFGDQGDKTPGRNAMITTAIFGGFDFSDTDKIPYGFTGLPSDSRNVVYPLTSCNPAGTWSEQCREWDKNKTGLPYNFYEADEGDTIATSISNALNDMLRRASSGTAASVLASAEGSGANILQAFFFPKRMFDDAEIDWTGEMQNLWYYIDPQIGNSTIREDTAKNNILDIFSDDIIEYEFDVGLGKTVVRRYQPNSAAQKGGEDIPSPVELDEAKNLWEAGILLWSRDLATSPRTIYTTVDGTNLINFDAAQAASNGTLQTYLQAPGDPALAENIVNYIHGHEVTGYRNRTVTTTFGGSTGTHVWKLGDIVSSTPRLKASFPLNSYHLYAPEGYNDRTYYQYVNDVDAAGNPTGIYKQRGMAFVGANDGMLHAFELGRLSFTGLTSTQAARLETVDATLGTERWAYVPRGALPYLKYLTSTNYCHVFYVNQPVIIVDASVNAGGSLSQDANYTKTRASWRTILIGGMGIGGACRDTTSSCTNCVKTPVSGIGYSSYFAFDITDPLNPVLLWEFSRDDLGFSTTGPAIVRVGNPDKNGKWFVVFSNGSTGPINTTYHQFMGSSDQNLKFFVLDLLSGPKTSVTVIDTGIANAFGASLSGSSFDVDRGNPTASGATPYSDDVIYMGYTMKDTTAWTKGGVVRLATGNSTNPSSWTVSKVIDNIGPVTTSLTKIQDRKNGKLWLYFGTGRYFYRINDGSTIDDPDSQQAFYGVLEPCYMAGTNTLNAACTTSVSIGDLQNQTGSSSNLSPTALGWYINFPTPDTGYKAHRVLAQPVASYNGVVYFLTSSPSTDVCSLGGYTYLWAVWYNNGGAPPPGALSGMVVTQLSTGQIATPILKKSDGSSALTQAGGKAMAVGQGVNIGGGFSLLGPPKPIRKILHMKER